MNNLSPDQIPEKWGDIASAYSNAFEKLTSQFADDVISRLSPKTGESVLDVAANYVSPILVLAGTMLTALSIYFYSERPTPPENISVYFVAPIVIGSCVVAIMYVVTGTSIPAHMLNGFAVLAISGSILRIQSNPLKDERVYWRRVKKERSPTIG